MAGPALPGPRVVPETGSYTGLLSHVGLLQAGPDRPRFPPHSPGSPRCRAGGGGTGAGTGDLGGCPGSGVPAGPLLPTPASPGIPVRGSFRVDVFDIEFTPERGFHGGSGAHGRRGSRRRAPVDTAQARRIRGGYGERLLSLPLGPAGPRRGAGTLGRGQREQEGAGRVCRGGSWHRQDWGDSPRTERAPLETAAGHRSGRVRCGPRFPPPRSAADPPPPSASPGAFPVFLRPRSPPCRRPGLLLFRRGSGWSHCDRTRSPAGHAPQSLRVGGCPSGLLRLDHAEHPGSGRGSGVRAASLSPVGRYSPIPPGSR